MSLNLQELKSVAATLSRKEQAELAEYLLRSLDDSDTTEFRAEWVELADRRLQELRTGAVAGIPADEVIKSLLEPRK